MINWIKNIVKRLLGIKVSEWALRITRDNDRVLKLLENRLTTSSCCIDVGAHQGSFLDFYIRFAPNGKHLAFEPLPDYYNKVVEVYPNVIVHNVALSDFIGSSTFHDVKGAEAMSGFKKQHYPTEVNISEIEVKVSTLDSYLHEIKNVDFIKIDVEGAELSVLKGAMEVIRTCQPIIMFEFAKLHTASYGITPLDVFQFFDDLNYEIWRLDEQHIYTLETLELIFLNSQETGYNRNAETNFLAIPKK